MTPRRSRAFIKVQVRLIQFPALLWIWAFATVNLATAAGVFEGPAASYERMSPSTGSASEVMRWVWVQERMQLSRWHAAVRVPLFFAAGECHDPAELMIVRWPSREPVAVQVDDVRRNADGGVARLHLWFVTNVGAGETQRWALLKQAPGAAAENVIPVKMIEGKLRTEVSGTAAEFNFDLTRHGPLASLLLENGPSLIFGDGAGATAEMHSAAGEEVITPGGGGSLDWGSGPVFAKVVARLKGPAGGEIEQVFRLFFDGSLNIMQSLKAPGVEAGLTVRKQEFLSGLIEQAGDIAVHPQSAGIVESLKEVHCGYAVDGLIEASASKGWLIVPGAIGGIAGRLKIENLHEFHLHAIGDMTSGSGDAKPRAIRAFWSEVTLYPANRVGEELERAALLAASQPLVAVVDRPGLDVAAAVSRIEENVREMKPVGWINETVVRHLNGASSPFLKRNWLAEENPEHWMQAAQRASDKVTGNGTHRLAEDEKGRAAGPLDPYHITYGSTGIAFWLMRDELPRAPRMALQAQLEAVRRQLGRVDEQGWPYLDVFARTQNMQMGPPFLALADRDAEPDIRRFYRDQLAAPQIAAVALRGLRPYEGRSQTTSVPSDELYQGVVDFFLRATELALNESLGFQPVAFGRYLDAIDVNADLYHPARSARGEAEDGFARANFFRMQSHLHRWLNWGPAPFIALLQSPVEKGLVPGSTEAWYFADALAGHWKNWPDQAWLFLAAELPQNASVYSPASRPAAAKNVRFEHGESGNHVTWGRSPLAAGYRVYRFRAGQSPVWLNSPYAIVGAGDTSALEWQDRAGGIDDRYDVHVLDCAGRESAW